jgi:hypothetical protein
MSTCDMFITVIYHDMSLTILSYAVYKCWLRGVKVVKIWWILPAEFKTRQIFSILFSVSLFTWCNVVLETTPAFVIHYKRSRSNNEFTVFSGVRVTGSLVLYVCFVDHYLSFCTFSFGHCVVCSSSIYGFW